MALAHHDAAQGDEGGGGEPKLLSTQQAGNGNVTTCAQLPINLQTVNDKPEVTGGQ
jgi:hypothetical protein